MPSLDRPGVEVEQTLSTTSPSLARPTLRPVVVGPCYDIVEATDSDGDFPNADAQLTTPAQLVSTARATFAMGSRALALIVNNGVTQSINLPGTADAALTAAAVVSAINAGITGVTAKVITVGATYKIAIYTSSGGTGTKIEVGSGTYSTVLTQLGFVSGQFSTGNGSYLNNAIAVDPVNFPISKGTAAERTIDTTTLRAFLKVSGSQVELKDDETVVLNHKLLGDTATVRSVLASIQDTDANSPTSPEFALQSREAYINFGSYDAAVGAGADLDSAFYIRALKTGNANGRAGNTVSFILVFDADSSLTIEYSLGTQVFAAGVANAITITAGIDQHADVAAFVAALNADATFAAHFAAGAGHWDGTAEVSGSGDGETADALTMSQSTTAMRFGADAYNLAPTDPGNPAVTSSLSYPNATHGALAGGETLKFRVNGGEEHTVTFAVEDAIADVVSAINTAVAGVSVGSSVHGITASASGTKLVLSQEETLAAAYKGHEATIEVTGGTALTKLFGADATAQGSHTFNSSSATKKFSVTARAGGNAAGANGESVTNIDFTVADTDLAGDVLYTLSIPGGQDAPTGIDIDIDSGHASFAETLNTYLKLVDVLNADNDFNQNFVAALAGGTGAGTVEVADTSVNQSLSGYGGRVDDITGLAIVGIHHGKPYNVRRGDQIYSGGSALGRVTELKALLQGNKTYSNAVLKMNAEIADSTAYTSWYVKAKEIPTSNGVGFGIPTPDLVVDADGTVNLKHHYHRNNAGEVVAAADLAYLQYTALRLDVTPQATSPALLQYDTQAALTAAIGPVNQNNPLALGMSLAMLNAPTIEVSGLGVSARSANAPNGTLTAYAEAFDFLSAQEVYAIAPLTQDETVHQTLSTHTTALSAVTQKKERMGLVSAVEPATVAPTTIASGLSSQSTDTEQELQIPLVEANILQELTDLGLSTPAAPEVSDGIYLITETSALKYSVSGVTAGNVLALRQTFTSGDNDDNFYATSAFPSSLLNEDWTLYQRGAAITALSDIATAMGVISAAYGNRRLVWVQPDQCLVTISGLNQEVGSQYACAAIAGMISQLNPSQPLTNYPMTGLVGVKSSLNHAFSEAQMSLAAGGGTYWLIQDTDGAPVKSRHQLTTDLTSVETRELSILKSIDFLSKFMRGSLQRFIGRYVITDQLLNMLGTVAQGVLETLKDSGVINSGDVTSVAVDSIQPDKVLLVVDVDPPYPCNTIRVTVVI